MKKLLVFLFLLMISASAVAQEETDNGFMGTGISELSDLKDFVEVERSEPADFNTTNGTKIFDKDDGLNMPTGFIVLILAFLGIVIYSVDIDPFWIAILLFLIAFSAVVYYLSLPEYLIPVTAVLVLAVKHFR